MVDFLDPVDQNLMDRSVRSSPKFKDLVDGIRACSPHGAFLISQGTLPWQPIKVEKSAFLQTNLLYRTAIPKRIAISQF